MRPTLLGTIVYLALPLAVLAGDTQSVDKSDYTLLNPVPGNQLRPLSSETYDGVMDARTVDAGHVQVEGEFIDYYFNSETPRTYVSDEFLWEPRVTVGLLNNLDFYLRPSYAIVLVDHSVDTSRFGRVTAGTKVNLLGNDGGTIALALKPFVSIPTDSGDDVLGGGDVALLARLPLGLLAKVDSEVYVTENNRRTHFLGFYNAISLTKTLCSKADAYGYFNATVTSDPSQTWYGYGGGGLEYNITSNLQVFAGIGFGVTLGDWVFGQTRAFDYNPRAGFVWRF